MSYKKGMNYVNLDNTPLVSVIIPVYNGANYLAQSIECTLNQTYKNLELIVVNDGSTEAETEQIALNYRGKDPRIKYFYKENGGVATAVNFGVSKSEGEYICWLSHDDLMPADKIERQIASISNLNQPAKTITYGKSIIIDEKGKIRPIKTAIFKVSKRGFKTPSEYFKIKHLIYSTLLIPRSFLVENPMVPDLRYSQDFYSFFQMLVAGYRLVYVKTATTYYRVHHSQGSFSMRKELAHDAEYENKTFVEYAKKTNDKHFLKKYLMDVAKKSGGYDIYKTILKSLLDSKEIKQLPKSAIYRAKATSGFYKFLYMVKRLLFSR